MKHTIKRVVLVASLAAGLTACGGGYYRSRSHYPPPPSRGYGYGVGVRPGPGYVWVGPYRDWRRDRYVQVPGGWMVPPRPHAKWVPGYWEGRGRHRRWVGACWR